MEEFNELFYKNPYLKEFEAKVIFCKEGKKGYEIILSDTAFYPEGGGQPADHGTLNGIDVIDAQRKNDVIIHYTKTPITEGALVHGVIDWNRRFDLMQNHSGEHIVSGIIHHLWGYENVGFRMNEVIEIDLSGPLSLEQLRLVERKANQVIWNNEEILISYPNEEDLKQINYRSKKELEGQVRIVTIPGADVCACCGTHVKYTGEIGMIKILSAMGHKGGTRLTLVCGGRALKDYELKHDENADIMHMLSLKPYETAQGVKNLKEQLAESEHAKTMLETKYLTYKLEQYKEDQKLIIDFEENMNRYSLIHFANDLVTKNKSHTAAVLSKDAEKWNYVIISDNLDLRSLSKQMNQRLNGRGGGKPETIQGSFRSTQAEIEMVLNEILGQ